MIQSAHPGLPLRAAAICSSRVASCAPSRFAPAPLIQVSPIMGAAPTDDDGTSTSCPLLRLRGPAFTRQDSDLGPPYPRAGA